MVNQAFCTYGSSLVSVVHSEFHEPGLSLVVLVLRITRLTRLTRNTLVNQAFCTYGKVW